MPRAPETDSPTNVLSVDVEDYFHVEAFADVVARTDWDGYERRVDANTRRLLDLFDRLGVTATFFVLGWVAAKSPRLVREIAARGHEVACHSYWHRLVYSLTPAEFREDTRAAKDSIEQAAGMGVVGYRAPSYSITRDSLWALEEIAAAGFQYDSSIFPIRHDVYGIPDAPCAPFRLATPAGDLVELPISTFRTFPTGNLPVGGGGYLRMLPSWYTRLGAARVAAAGRPLIVYVHPWEIDPDQPKLSGRLTSRLRHYTGLRGTLAKLERLITSGRFASVRDSGIVGSAPRLDWPASLAHATA